MNWLEKYLLAATLIYILVQNGARNKTCILIYSSCSSSSVETFFVLHQSHFVHQLCASKDRIGAGLTIGNGCWPGKRYVAIISVPRHHPLVVARSRERRLSTLCSEGSALFYQAALSLQTHLFAVVTPQMLSADDRLAGPHYDALPTELTTLVHCGYWENRVKQTRRSLQVHPTEGDGSGGTCATLKDVGPFLSIVSCCCVNGNAPAYTLATAG